MPPTLLIRRFRLGRAPKTNPIRNRFGPLGRRLEELEDRVNPSTSFLPLSASDQLLPVNTTGTQQAARIAMKADGTEFVAVWQAPDGGTNNSAGDFGIFARLFNANWQPIGNEFQVNTTTANSQVHPDVGMDANGNFVVAWESFGQGVAGATDSGIVAQRFNSSGTKLGTEFVVQTNNAGNASMDSPAVGVNASGEFVIAWDAGDGVLVSSVFAKEYGSITTGNVVSGANDVPISTFQGPGSPPGPPDPSTSDPDVAVDGSGNFTVVWDSFGQDTAAQNDTGVILRRFSAGGTPLGSESLVNVTTNGFQDHPSIAMDSSGNFVVAWQSDNVDGSGKAVVIRRFDAAGGTLGGEIQVNTTTAGDQFEPQIAMNASGTFTVVWSGQKAGSTKHDIYARQYNSSGTAITGEMVVSTPPGDTEDRDVPDVAMDAAGDFVTTFESPDTGHVYYRAFAQAPTVQFSAATESANENAGTANIGVTLSGAQYALANLTTVVAVTNTGGTAVAGTNYSTPLPPSVTFNATIGVTSLSQNLSVGVLDDHTYVPAGTTLTFALQASGSTPATYVLGSQTTNTLTIADTNAPASITITGGNNQSTHPSQAFGNALTVQIKDASGNAVKGVSVTFTAPASGASAVFSNSTNTITVTTDSSGNASSGALSANGTVGTNYTVTAAATGGSSPSADFTLTNQALAPTANSQSVSVAENVAKAITLTGSDPNTPPLPLTYTVTSGPMHGNLSGTAPNLTYTPNVGYFGPDSFQFTDSNGTATSNTATVSITVVGTPTANAQSVTLAENASNVAITLTGSDPNTPVLPLTFTVTSSPAHGTLSGSGANLTYTPNPGYFGPDSFQFTDSNGTATSSAATVSITVVGTPTANAQSLTLAQNASNVAITLTGSDPNTPPLPLTFTVTSGPMHGNLSGTAPNLTYTPDPGYFGPDSFQFTDSDGTATSNTATVSITVVGTPTANSQSVTLAENASNVAITLTGNDPNTPALPLTFSVTSGPMHGTLSGTGPNLTYTPDANYSGPDTFQFTVSNGTATSAPVTVSITVTAVVPTVPTPVVNAPAVSVTFRPFGEVIEVVTSAGVLTQFDSAGAHVLGGGVRSASAAFGPFGEVLVVAYQDGGLVQFDATGAHLLGTNGVHSASVAFGPFGEVLVETTEAGALIQIDAAGVHQLAASGVQDAGVAIDPLASVEVLLVLFPDGALWQFSNFGSFRVGTVS
jgi:hypothetical protein